MREPGRDCRLCPRLAAFRKRNRQHFPDFHNSPVPSFGGAEARLLVVGLAPGLKGANRTGRPFTGDYAGDLLYATLAKFGFARGAYGAEATDGLRLAAARITNAVRCVPPENKPSAAEVATCRGFLAAEIAALRHLGAILALGAIAHAAVVASFGLKPARCAFAHGAEHALSPRLRLFDSYHCSRLNTNTGRLTPAMFEAIFARIVAHLAIKDRG
ncbi:MAG TPA: uracil-DNA glycosylase [Alphaproteobacteria bacterium]|nr:uracil-DNA glycosylase [Alphaproteobacteria bacterium]